MKYSLLAVMALILSVQPAFAQESGVPYTPDPVYSAVIDGAEHPLQGLFDLANEEDPRALFILGDLYSKQKGGAKKNPEAAALMFEHSAKLGVPEALIRLAAMAKERGDNVAAYKWYEIAERRLIKGDTIKYVRQAQDALQLEPADEKTARDAARQWELEKLTPLRLNNPINPIKTSPPADTAKPAASSQTSTDDSRGETVVDTTETQ